MRKIAFLRFHKKKNRASRAGFTLVEMAITATIMIITSSMLIAFTQTGGNRLVLSTEQAKIGGVLNRAKSLALQRYKANEGSICGFAFLFNEPVGTYSLLPVTRLEDGGECVEIGAPTETFLLNPNVQFATAGSDIIIFESPYLTTRNPLTLAIALKDKPEETAGVEVTAGGAVILH
jgi:hypothetical protein